MGIKTKPYNLLLYFAILLFITSFMVSGLLGDLNFPDTYRIVPLDGFLIVMALVLILFWILYKLTARFLNSLTLTWAHVMLTILGSLICILLFISNITEHNVQNPDSYDTVGVSIGGPILIPVLIQLIYFINLFAGTRQTAKP